MSLFRKKSLEATNEFNQVVVGNSLSKDAWRRLKKNKMAVIGMIVVIIYTLIAACAGLLPIYPYDEIILDHQHLPPSFTQNAGDLMRVKKLEDIYAKAWKAGRLAVSPEEDAQLKQWVTNNQNTKVWQFCYTEGEAQRAAGTFEFSASEKRTLDRLEEKIATELQVTVKHVYWTDPSTGKRYDVAKMPYEEMLPLYASMLGLATAPVEEQTNQEIRAELLNNIKTTSTDFTDDEYATMVEGELDALGEKGYAKLATENIYGKIVTQSRRAAEKSLQVVVADENAKFPLKQTFEVGNDMTAQVEASKKHARKYILGTDYSGRDMLSRIIYGGQVSIAIGFVGTLTSVLIGIVLGAIAGYVGGKTDYILMRFVDIMYGLPYMLLVIICMAIFGRNILNLFLALALVSWLTIARMVRGQIMSLKNQEFVEAARSMGASTGRIIFKHLVPNSLSVIIVYSTLRIPAFIMQESFLSFLGLGVQAPYASWGSLVGDAVASMTLYPWKLIFPALAMIVFLFAMNFLGDGLRDAFDPQSKNQL